jgi:hypothetical protein
MTPSILPKTARPTPSAIWIGLGAIALGVGFNAPYAALAGLYDYPQVLRRPPGEALDLFVAGGDPLILAWYAFMLSALALVPLAVGLSITPGRLAARPALAIGAAICGALAGLSQAIGLSRWVFAIPMLARDTDRAAAEQSFALLNAWGGVAIGEHLGQTLTVLFVAQLAALQWGEARRITATLGGLTAILLTIGTAEALALALGRAGDVFALFTIAGFATLTAWLIATGLGLIRTRT